MSHAASCSLHGSAKLHHEADLQSTVSERRPRIKVQISPGVACTITGVRLINTDNQVWATKAISVVLETADTNLLQWFDFEITEEES